LVDVDSKGLELGWTRTRLEYHSKGLGLDSSHRSRGLGLEMTRVL